MNEDFIQQIPEHLRMQVVAMQNRIVEQDEEIRRWKRVHFASKSERHIEGTFISPKGTLFNEPESIFEFVGPPLPPNFDQETKVKSKPRPKAKSKGGGRAPLPDDLERERVVCDLQESEKQCQCGACLTKKIGENTVEVLEYVPGSLKVVQYVYPKYACSSCQSGVRKAPAMPQALPRSQCGPGLLSQIITCKYALGLPLYRMEKDFEEMGLEISRTSMARWMIGAYKFLKPLLALLKSSLTNLDTLHADETHVQVLKEQGKKAESKSYMWTMCSAKHDTPMVWFEYNRTRSGKSAEELLGNFKGLLHADGYAGYNSVVSKNGIKRVGCWAHVRRKFDSAKKDGGKNGKSLASQFLSRISRLFVLERNWAELSAEERKAKRNEKSKKIVESIESLMLDKQQAVTPSSKLGSALHYMREQWDTLVVFLEDGNADLSNNRMENFIRPFVVGRKGWLFSDRPAGAEASAGLYSLIISARANGVHARPYLTSLFSELPSILAADPDADLSGWLPWRWKARAEESDFIDAENIQKN